METNKAKPYLHHGFVGQTNHACENDIIPFHYKFVSRNWPDFLGHDYFKALESHTCMHGWPMHHALQSMILCSVSIARNSYSMIDCHVSVSGLLCSLGQYFSMVYLRVVIYSGNFTTTRTFLPRISFHCYLVRRRSLFLFGESTHCVL